MNFWTSARGLHKTKRLSTRCVGKIKVYWG